MNLIAPTLDAAFIEKQRRHLVELRAALLEPMQNDEAEEAGIKHERLDRPQEYEDDTQKLTKLELGGNLVVRIRKRLAVVQRALKKLEGGTYRVSDVSGRSIPRERLEGIPEAICTLEEEDALEHFGWLG
jgi:DnaK suppressor protein